jgi:hypothetical protein
MGMKQYIVDEFTVERRSKMAALLASNAINEVISFVLKDI